MAARAASASRLPAAVGALGAALPGPRVPPEAFRLAKLGRPHACDTPLKSLQDGESLPPKSHMKDQRDVRYLQWLNGRLQFQWRKCHTEQQEQCKLLNKVHSYTIGSHTDPIIGHFSITEADVVRQPENYKQVILLWHSAMLETMENSVNQYVCQNWRTRFSALKP
uniref:uncharacterized protein LOC114598612 isoform X2 n=1 Tax=Podarcis muralis TaxID=64176 RepID=UPI00109F1782|nr:uncharacterized protein LOC114598612 isoform X2 [Podarcis muralis]